MQYVVACKACYVWSYTSCLLSMHLHIISIMYIQYVLHVMFVINEAARDACQLCSYILVSMHLHDVCHNMKLQEMSCLNLHVMSVTYAVTFLSVCSYMIPAMYAATRDACHVCSYSWCLSRMQLHVMPVMNAATRDACHGCSCT